LQRARPRSISHWQFFAACRRGYEISRLAPHSVPASTRSSTSPAQPSAMEGCAECPFRSLIVEPSAAE
jgi:hypothetical protein